MSVTIIIAFRIGFQKIFVTVDGAIRKIKVLVTVAREIESLFSFPVHGKLSVSPFIPFNRILVVFLLVIPAAELKEGFRAPSALGKITDDGQPVGSSFSECPVELINARST